MKLIIPSEEHLKSYADAISEYQRNNVTSYDFIDITKDNIFEQIDNLRTGKNLPENYVKGTYLWLVHNNEFVGESNIRHSLTNALLRFGGNIGYAIRYSQWNKGLGTILLAKTLVYAKEEIGLKRVLITCGDDNLASARVIEKNGGVLRDRITNVINGSNRLTRRYWIDL